MDKPDPLVVQFVQRCSYITNLYRYILVLSIVATLCCMDSFKWAKHPSFSLMIGD